MRSPDECIPFVTNLNNHSERARLGDELTNRSNVLLESQPHPEGGQSVNGGEVASRAPNAIQWRTGSGSRPDKPLSSRERSVLRLIACGLSNKYIARELNIAPDTVKSHARNILAKFRAKTRAEAVAYAARRQII